MGDIGNVDPELPMAVFGAFEANRSVKVFRVIRINGDHAVLSAINAAN